MFSRKKQTELSILIFPRLKPISDRILYELEKISSSDDKKSEGLPARTSCHAGSPLFYPLRTPYFSMI